MSRADSTSDCHLKIDVRNASIHHVRNFSKSALAVKFSRARRTIEGIQPNDFAACCLRDPPRLLDASPAHSFALLDRIHCHRPQIQRHRAGSKVVYVD